MPFGARTAKILLVTPVAVYVALSVLYLFVPRYFDWVESGILATAWAFVSGVDLYQSPESGIQHNLPYGPYVFIIHGFFLWLFSPTLWSGKIAGVLFANFAFVALYLTARRMGAGRTVAWVAPAAHASFLFLIWPYDTYTARADSFVMGLVAASALAMTLPSSTLSALAFGIAAGITVNVKINAAIYFLPVLGIFWRRINLRFLVVSGLGFLAFLVLPFLFDAIDVQNYLAIVTRHTRMEFSWVLAFKRFADILVLYLLPIFLPVYLFRVDKRSDLRAHLPFLVAVAVTFTICLIIASKLGSTRTQLAPVGLVLGLWLALYLSGVIKQHGAGVFAAIQGKRRIAAWVLYGLIFLSVPATIPRAFSLVAQGQENQRAIDEIRTLQARFPGKTMAVGYGDSWSERSWNRSLLVFDGNPNFAELGAIGDQALAGRGVPLKVIQTLRNCRVAYYLIPKGEQPFRDPWLNGLPLFDADFLRQFSESFVLRTSEPTTYYDVWECTKQ